jgi:L-aspartate oxidase
MVSSPPVLIVGGGVAGLATALHLAPLIAPAPVVVVAHATLGTGSSTRWAQGGLAASIGEYDSPELHALDTVKAGAGLTDPATALRVAKAAPSCIDWLVELGAQFDRDDKGQLVLGLEAAHGQRRIVRAQGDSTGRAVLETLIKAAKQVPNLSLMQGVQALDLAMDHQSRVAGLVCRREEEEPFVLAARNIVLATGGIGGLYAHTTNPLSALGAGLAMAARAGAVLRDMEFVQFHPTAIAGPVDPMPLATEALRGEGAVLVTADGHRFMQDVPGQELAARDVVARAIFEQTQKGHPVFLDARIIGPHWPTRFPTVHAFCVKAGIDPEHDLIPVRPAAHYHCGGIQVDEHGRSSLPGLWVCGEAASTGLHGANRLASNSLIEALAYAVWIAEDIAKSTPLEGASLSQAPHHILKPMSQKPMSQENLSQLRSVMDRDVGVLRSEPGLTRAITFLKPLQHHSEAQVALLIAEAALKRTESQGSHTRRET